MTQPRLATPAGFIHGAFMESTTRAATLSYHAPDVIEAGFAWGQPVLDIHQDGAYAGCLFRSYRNKGRRLEAIWQFHRKGGQPTGPKFETLEELLLWVQSALLEGAA